VLQHPFTDLVEVIGDPTPLDQRPGDHRVTVRPMASTVIIPR
jgi:hypothetical protein